MANDNDGGLSEPKRIYYSIAGQLPDSAQRVVLEYLPHLEASVDDVVRHFGRELAHDLKKRASEELCGGRNMIVTALDAIVAEKEVTVEHKGTLARLQRDLKGVRKAMNRLGREVGQLREMESNRCALDSHVHVLDKQIIDFRLRRAQEGIGTAADYLRAFYEGWEPAAKDICSAIDHDGLGSILRELREVIEGVGRATGDDDEGRGNVEQEGCAEEVGSGVGYDVPASRGSLASGETSKFGSDVAETPDEPAADDVVEATDEPQEGNVAGEEGRSYDVRSDEDELDPSQALPSVDAVCQGGPSTATAAPTKGTPKNDASPDYCLAELANALRCIANKKLDERTRAASRRVRKIGRKCDKLLRRQATALDDAREGVKASVCGIENAKTAVKGTAKRVCRAIENGIAAAKLDLLPRREQRK